MVVGWSSNGLEVRISKRSPNQNLIVSGQSGSGKSIRLENIKEECIKSGGTVIDFDIDGTHPAIEGKDTNVISAKEDGLNLPILDTSRIASGFESEANFLAYTVEMFSNAIPLGIRQQGALREAIKYAAEKRNEYANDMEAIAEGLQYEGTGFAMTVHEKLWGLLNCGIFRKSSKAFQKGKINILSLKGINPSQQRAIAEIFLSCIWREIRTQHLSFDSLTLVIDEFQNLSVKKNSTLMEMLREARKYNVQLVLATQSLTAFSKETLAAINQAAVRIYFRPSKYDKKRVAEEIDSNNPGPWMIKLEKLDVGKSVVTGDLCMNGREFSGPVILRSNFKPEATKFDTRSQLIHRKF